MKHIFLILLLALSLEVPSAYAQEEPAAEAEHAAEEEHHESPFTVVFRWVNFIILFGGLGYLLKKPALDFFEGRRREISEGLDRAERAQRDAELKMAEIDRKLGMLSTEMAALKAKAEKDSETEREHIVTEARREVARIVEQSRQEIERVARSVERDIKEHVADLVIDRAGRTLRTEMSQDDQKRVVVRFIKNL